MAPTPKWERKPTQFSKVPQTAACFCKPKKITADFKAIPIPCAAGLWAEPEFPPKSNMYDTGSHTEWDPQPASSSLISAEARLTARAEEVKNNSRKATIK